MKKAKPKTFETEEKSTLYDKFVSKAGHSKKCPSCRKLQKNSGITLATLVITIVVMLILAGVTVHTMIGDNGLIDSAKDLKENVETKDADMQDTINDLEIELNKGIPDIIAAIERGTNFINLSEVQLIDSENRQADAFEYYYKKASEGDSSYKKVDGATGAELQLTGLIHNTSYKIKIIAKKNNEALRTAVKNIKTKELLCADLNMQVEEGGSVYTSDTWTNKNIKVALVDATRSTYSTVEGSAQTIAQTNGESTVSEAGTTTIKVETTDGTNTVSKNYYVKIDRVAPTLIITSQGQPDQYPDVLTIKAQDNAVAIDHIELPDGTKIAGNGKNIFTTTYNATKNGPITCKVADALGNEGTGDFEVENVINFETEWTILEDNTTVQIPVVFNYQTKGELYIDYGDGTKENVKTRYPVHTYEKSGIYTVKISGKCEQCYSNSKYVTKLKKWGCLENISYSFSDNKQLKGEIPQPHYNSFEKITSFYRTFDGCTGLTGGIPENFFVNCPNTADFACTFERCSGLTGNIPENLFGNCCNATGYSRVFYKCSGLTGSIPENLFINCVNAENFNETFGDCTGLTGNIPEKLFSNCKNAKTFGYTNIYYNENGSGSASGGGGTFSGCSGLTGTIPEKLFENCTEATSFAATFYFCRGLTGNIPEKLFENCKNVIEFDTTFAWCTRFNRGDTRKSI